MFTQEFFRDIADHLHQPGVLFFNSYQEFLRTGAEVFPHLLCVREALYQQAFFYFTNFPLLSEQEAQFYEAFPRQFPGRIYTNNKVHRITLDTSAPKAACLS
jgi:spermidine synthase